MGRVIFGLGGECMSVSQSAIVSNWFKGKELSFAFGLTLCVARLGSVLNGVTVSRMASSHGVGFALYIGAMICCLSFVCAIVLAAIDRYADKKDNKTVVLTEADKFQLKDLKEFSLSFWLIVLSCVFVYMSIFPFIQNSESLMEQKFGFSSETAGTWYGMPYFMSAFLSPVLGFCIDKVGKRALIIMFSSCIVCLACVITMFLPNYTEENWIIMVPLCMLGVGYSVYASALWGSIPYVVKPANLGTAFGITTAVQNTGLTIAPLAIGYIQD